MPKQILPTTDSLLIGFDFSKGKDVGVLVVGRKRLNQSVEIINAFQGKEAEDIYEMLTTQKTTKVDDIKAFEGYKNELGKKT